MEPPPGIDPSLFWVTNPVQHLFCIRGMVRIGGLEPPRLSLDTTSSGLRGYLLRHIRILKREGDGFRDASAISRTILTAAGIVPALRLNPVHLLCATQLSCSQYLLCDSNAHIHWV